MYRPQRLRYLFRKFRTNRASYRAAAAIPNILRLTQRTRSFVSWNLPTITAIRSRRLNWLAAGAFQGLAFGVKVFGVVVPFGGCIDAVAKQGLARFDVGSNFAKARGGRVTPGMNRIAGVGKPGGRQHFAEGNHAA